MNDKRRPVRDERGQLVTLINDWDPAGLIRAGGTRTEYDALADDLLALLEKSTSEEQVAAFLEREIGQRFHAPAPNAPRFATKVIAWFRMADNE